jgi:hypothetical protein
MVGMSSLIDSALAAVADLVAVHPEGVR